MKVRPADWCNSVNCRYCAANSAATGSGMPEACGLFDFDRAISTKSELRAAVCGCSGIVSGGPSVSIAEPAADPFDLFDEAVVALGTGVGDSGLDERVDLGPLLVDGCGPGE
jgi:hypothetical protein